MEYIATCNTTTGSGFLPHMHTEHEIVVFLSGNGTYWMAGKSYPFTAGTIVVIPPNTVHSSSSDGEVERIYLKGAFEAVLAARAAIFDDEPDGEGIQLIRLVRRHRFGNPNYFNALCHAFLQFTAGHLYAEDLLSEAVRQVVRRIGDTFANAECRVADLLRESGYAEDYIRAHFKRLTGKTPQTFLTQVRIQHACFLMETYRRTLTLAQVGEQCGYTDYVQFSKKFKAVTGVSPREYVRSR